MSKQYFKVKIIQINIVPAEDRVYQGTAKKRNISTGLYEAADITGGTITLTVKSKDAAVWADQTLWKSFPAVLTTPASGIYTVTFLDTDSSDDDLGVYDHRIEYIDDGGLKHLLAMGDFRVGY